MAEYSVIKDYLCVSTEGKCTCGAATWAVGQGHPHQPDCGWEPIAKVEHLLAEEAIKTRRITWALVNDHDEVKRVNELLRGYGISYPQGAAGVADLMAFAKRHQRQAEIAKEAIQFLRNKGFIDDANRFDNFMEGA